MNNKESLFRALWLISAASASLISLSVQAHAEGDKTGQWPKAFGANRVVRTPSTGFVGVEGTFSVGSFYIPVLRVGGDDNKPIINPSLMMLDPAYKSEAFDTYLSSVPASEAPGYISNQSNPNDDKPSFYFGSGGAPRSLVPEVDSGIQREWLPLYQAPPGWAVFISNGSFFPVSVSRPGGGLKVAFRAGAGTNNPGVSKFTLHYNVGVTPGVNQGFTSLLVELDSKSGAVQNPAFIVRSDSRVYQNAQFSQLNVKRVIAMTQIGDYKLDGSSMTNYVFDAGRVARYVGGMSTWSPSWAIGDVDNVRTGYIPGAAPTVRGWPTGDMDQGRPRHFMVDFPGLTVAARVNTPAITPSAIRSQWHNAYTNIVAKRYVHEAIDINLQVGSKVVGLRVTRGR